MVSSWAALQWMQAARARLGTDDGSSLPPQAVTVPKVNIYVKGSHKAEQGAYTRVR
jgi:hypothetical protein